MKHNILAPIIRNNETIALCVIKPFENLFMIF